jgi:hypothetical protein
MHVPNGRPDWKLRENQKPLPGTASSTSLD